MTVVIILLALILLGCLVGTILSPYVWARHEPRHTLILSWLAMDISVAQLLGQAITYRQVREQAHDRDQ